MNRPVWTALFMVLLVMLSCTAWPGPVSKERIEELKKVRALIETKYGTM